MDYHRVYSPIKMRHWSQIPDRRCGKTVTLTDDFFITLIPGSMGRKYHKAKAKKTKKELHIDAIRRDLKDIGVVPVSHHKMRHRGRRMEETVIIDY